MLCYKVGTKVVPLSDLGAAPEWFKEDYVIVDRLDGDLYRVVDIKNKDHSWLADNDIDHIATDKLNTEDK